MGGTWKRGDVISCLLDLTTCSMMVSLNGELLLNSRGSEVAVKDFNKSDGVYSLIISHSVFTQIYHIYIYI